MKKLNTYLCYKKIFSKYSLKFSTILFNNKEKIESEQNNLTNRKSRKIWSSITSKSNVELWTGKNQFKKR